MRLKVVNIQVGSRVVRLVPEGHVDDFELGIWRTLSVVFNFFLVHFKASATFSKVSLIVWPWYSCLQSTGRVVILYKLGH